MSNIQRRLASEALVSFILAWEAIFIWNIMAPFIGVVERLIRQPGPWAQLTGVIGLFVSYYILLSITLPIAQKYNAQVHPISLAYFGGWWLVVLLAALSVQSAAFNNVLGLSMASSGTNLVFITLFVGLAKYWIDGYRNPPKAPTQSEVEQSLDSAAKIALDVTQNAEGQVDTNNDRSA